MNGLFTVVFDPIEDDVETAKKALLAALALTGLSGVIEFVEVDGDQVTVDETFGEEAK